MPTQQTCNNKEGSTPELEMKLKQKQQQRQKMSIWTMNVTPQQQNYY